MPDEAWGSTRGSSWRILNAVSNFIAQGDFMDRRRFAASLLTTALVAGLAPRLPAGQKAEVAHTQLKVGDAAPDFTLLDNKWKPVHLSDFRGKKNVVLAFYVLAFTEG